MKNNLIPIMILILLLIASPAMADQIVIIVNASNPATTISAQDIRDYFLKRKKSWPDRTPVRFIDRTDSPERREFLTTIMKRGSEDLDEFWIGQKLYTGDSAPIQCTSNAMATQFVSTFKGAIGYISADTIIKVKGIKTIEVVGDQ